MLLLLTLAIINYLNKSENQYNQNKYMHNNTIMGQSQQKGNDNNVDIFHKVLTTYDLTISPKLFQTPHSSLEIGESNFQLLPFKQFQLDPTSPYNFNFDLMLNLQRENFQEFNILPKQNAVLEKKLLLQSEDYSHTILQQKRTNKSQSSNNIPKFLLKMFLKYFKQDSQNIYKTQVKNTFKVFTRKLRAKNSSGSLKLLCRGLEKIFVADNHENFNRKLLWQILRKRSKEQILKSTKVVKKLLYCNATKIYRLRCRSSTLIKRTSIK